jgi:magnesium transporter
MEAFWYRKGSLERVAQHTLTTNLQSVLHSGERLWIDIADPTAQDYDFLRRQLHVHPRTLETIKRGTSRPQLEEYETYLFVALYGLDEHGHFTQLSFLLGERFLVTIHKRRVHSFELLKRDKALVTALLARDTEFVMHALIETEALKYTPILERFDAQISSLDERVTVDRSSSLVKEIFHLKHQLITLKHHLAPQKEVLYNLSRRGVKFIMPSASDLFRDVSMHIVSAVDSIDNYREILNGTLDVHLSVTSNHLNDIIKVLTVFSTIFLPLTLVASIYGMNFVHMPELSWKYGYFLVLGVMGVISVFMLGIFRRLRWV